MEGDELRRLLGMRAVSRRAISQFESLTANC